MQSKNTSGIGFSHCLLIAVCSLFYTQLGASAFQDNLPTLTGQGPWGAVESFPITLEPPEYLLRPQEEMRAHENEIVWSFSERSKPLVADSLREVGLAETDIEMLLGERYCREAKWGLELYPPEELVMRLTSTQRSRLYPMLDGNIFNNVYVEPYFIDFRGFRALASNSGLTPKIIDLISTLCYRKYGPMLFSDISLVMRQAADESERMQIFKTLKRERALSVQLKVSERSDLDTMVDYWGAQGRNNDALPILESLLATSGVDSMDVVHLLPPTPRKLVNTYGNPHMAIGRSYPDCYWTAFNFFSYEPSNRFLDEATCDKTLDERYEKASKPWKMGDLIVIYDGDGRWVHACNYIAGNIVFTKNGVDICRPWIFGDLESVLSNYLYSERVHASFYRLKPEHQRG